MVSNQMKERISTHIELPSLPRTASRILTICKSSDEATSAVADALEEDPALAAKVLGLANTPIYGLAEPVRSIRRAAMALGLNAIYNIVLQAEIKQRFAELKDNGIGLEKIWRHSVLVARICKDLATAAQPEGLPPEELYTCGLLHDLGKISMYAADPDRYLSTVLEARTRNTPSYLIERRDYGYTHTEVGAMIAHLWTLPEEASQAIECHHMARVRLRDKPSSLMVAMADDIAKLVDADRDLDEIHYETNPIFRYLGYTHNDSQVVADAAAVYHAAID